MKGRTWPPTVGLDRPAKNGMRVGRFVTDATAALHVLETEPPLPLPRGGFVARVFVAIVGDGVFGAAIIDHNDCRCNATHGRANSGHRQPCNPCTVYPANDCSCLLTTSFYPFTTVDSPSTFLPDSLPLPPVYRRHMNSLHPLPDDFDKRRFICVAGAQRYSTLAGSTQI